MLNLCERVSVMKEQERLTGTDLIAAFISRRVLPLQQRSHLIGQMTGLQDPNCMANTRLAADQVARRVNDISKANLGVNWEFGMAPYSRSDLAPLGESLVPVLRCCLSSYLPRRDARGASERHLASFDRARVQVVRVASEEPEAHGGGEAAAADTGAGHRAGESCLCCLSCRLWDGFGDADASH